MSTRLPHYTSPAYCAADQWIVTYDASGRALVHFVSRVDRPWKLERGLHVKPLSDGSRRPFEPEESGTNGRNPCLLFIEGEPRPWYFDSGHDSVNVLSLGRRDSGD